MIVRGQSHGTGRIKRETPFDGSSKGVGTIPGELFNYYVSVARNMDFRKRFSEMTLISLGVAALSFGVGRGLGKVLGVDIG